MNVFFVCERNDKKQLDVLTESRYEQVVGDTVL